VIEKLANIGTIKRKIAYANWARESQKNWHGMMIKYSIESVQQFDFTKTKNASDIKLVIDAMRLLYEKSTDAFAIVSSDSDFTPLVQTIRSHDLPVYGFGEEKSTDAFRNACTKFFTLEKRHKMRKSTISNGKQLKKFFLTNHYYCLKILNIHRVSAAVLL
jgi:uncharacterized LabA/DUF88 family protein